MWDLPGRLGLWPRVRCLAARFTMTRIAALYYDRLHSQPATVKVRYRPWGVAFHCSRVSRDVSPDHLCPGRLNVGEILRLFLDPDFLLDCRSHDSDSHQGLGIVESVEASSGATERMFPYGTSGIRLLGPPSSDFPLHRSRSQCK